MSRGSLLSATRRVRGRARIEINARPRAYANVEIVYVVVTPPPSL
jgi:hypothetical protein